MTLHSISQAELLVTVSIEKSWGVQCDEKAVSKEGDDEASKFKFIEEFK